MKRRLTVTLLVEALLALGASTAGYVLFRYVYHALTQGGRAFDLLPVLVAPLPLTLSVIIIFVAFAQHLNHRTARLADGLRAVADGDFSVRLDAKKGGPLRPAFQDFNTMAAELQSVQTLRSDFIHNFSHEFKTPITAIAGFAELLQEPGCTEEDRAQYLQVILDEANRLAELASSTLLLSQLDAQQSVPDKAPYALDEQIKQCVILLSGAWNRKKLAFSADLPEVIYSGSAEMMRHVWLNLLNNAIKFTPEGGEIEVTMRRGEGCVEVAVSDTGIGMSEEIQAHMFDKYYQGDPSHTGKGLGLGLSIVHRIVELCGGRIDVRSRENEGSTFTVVLPL